MVARRRLSRCLVLTLLTILAATSVSPGSARGETTSAPEADDGARVVRETRVSDRVLDLEISSPALGRIAMVRLLVPAGWHERARRDWPVLWLLHGCCEPADYRSWTQFTDVEEFTANLPVLVVMPSGGRAGMYSAWWNFGLGGAPDWERFHVTEVRQILERGYGAGARRAVAGLSVGGFGAMHYAFRHPDLFGAAASYSGLLNTLGAHVPELIKGILVREGFPLWLALWGSEHLNRALWVSHNPYDNIERLRGKPLYVSSGNGLPGPFDPPYRLDALESAASVSSQEFTRKLRHAGIEVTTDFGAGTHSWPYWQQALRRSWPVLAKGLGL
ncbi:S-formylglutathione hydrolase FrmB [Streptoalloteichus tenebrarius]|uniref:S-formylglutathione hydrolase FrmB n=1 Tax=Streptoalloteichus tenebrarius (strain ATCC 17920 / DSM 40477 / JCM 4838 / CBS 697.72 / NBRC 16177 / NCIMB 11028 / NRRL B-12390 / A12253. 1 / ISP 5477) TaxID=1933 RepID=A0ABT1HLT3_STRSD|nr:alpha/beta hydrolase family protein [Streptoalloteichus tenebrarius]MCP2256455.1 S-formylglutathione hydrolase FrmB [Streptoalloteichus tenebrarius]BFF04806.1 alpha/beta hydrolase family protein [Streptoalloteichus tenebrarius]